MREMSSAAVLRRPDDVVSGVGKGSWQKAAVIVPLRAHVGDAVTAIVRQPEDMRIAAGGGRVDTMCAVQFPSAPPAADPEEILGRQISFVPKDEKSPKCHFPFQSGDYLVWQYGVRCEVKTADLGADRLQGCDLATSLAYYGNV